MHQTPVTRDKRERFSIIPLAKDTETRTPSAGTKNNKFVSGLKFSSINVNGTSISFFKKLAVV